MDKRLPNSSSGAAFRPEICDLVQKQDKDV